MHLKGWILLICVCEIKWNITTQSAASPRTPHLSMMPIVTFTFELWPPNSIGSSMANMSAKFDDDAHNSVVCIGFTAYFCTCLLWPWHFTSKINRYHSLTMANMSVKLEAEMYNDLVAIMFTIPLSYMSNVIWPLTSDLQNQQVSSS